MVFNPITISPDTPLVEAARKMREKKIGSLIVAENNKPIGIITERDLVWRVIAEGKDINTFQASDIYSTPVLTIHEDSRIEEAIKLMNEKGVRRLVVINIDGKVSGILTSDDIIRNIESISRELAIEYITMSRNIHGHIRKTGT
jgi:CBS domain-containing protein